MQGVNLIFRLSDIVRYYKQYTVTPITNIPLPAIKYAICIAVEQAISDTSHMGKIQALYIDPLYNGDFSDSQVTLLTYVGSAVLEVCKVNTTIQNTKNKLLCSGDLVVNETYIYPNIDQVKVEINGWV